MTSRYDIISPVLSEENDLVRELLSARRLIDSSPDNLNFSRERERREKRGVTSHVRSPMMTSYSEGDFRLAGEVYGGEALRKLSRPKLDEGSSVWTISSRRSSLPVLPQLNNGMRGLNQSLREVDDRNSADEVEYCRGDDERKTPLFPPAENGTKPGLSDDRNHVKGLPMSVQEFKSRTSRDPQNINNELKIDFCDVIAEPEGFDTPKFSWHASKELYGFGKSCCYTIISFLCGIPAGFFWGLWFAMLSCATVWCFTPLRKSHMIHMSCLGACWRDVIATLCDPICLSCSKMFKSVNVVTEKHVV